MVERARLIPGHYGVPGAAYDGSTTGLSADGRTLVLAESTTMRGTRLLVLDTDKLVVRKRITRPEFLVRRRDLARRPQLYVLRYPKVRRADCYDVLALDLRTGRLNHKPIMDPREPDEQMGGMPLSRVMSPDGRWAYTLYMGEENFVHALDTLKRRGALHRPARAATSPASRCGSTARRCYVGHAEKIDLRTFALAKADGGDRDAARDRDTGAGRARRRRCPVGAGGARTRSRRRAALERACRSRSRSR